MHKSPKPLPFCQVKMWTFDNPKSLLFTISGLVTTSFVNAQNSSCRGYRDPFRTVNSTGLQEFTWNASYAGDDPWYASVLVGPQGPDWNDRSDVRGNAYISVPENVPNRTEVCIYQYLNINTTLESGGDDSCSGVISSGCIDHLTKVLSSSTNRCPHSDTTTTSEAFKKACPMLKGGSHGTFLPLSLYKPPLCSFFLPHQPNTIDLRLGICNFCTSS
jgi:hypothetical protein